MKWLKRLSHKFWVWLGNRIEYHEFEESIKCDWQLDIDIEKSRQMTQAEINYHEDIVAIVKGYEKP